MEHVTDTEFNESASELLSKAISAGFKDITPKKLARWHQEGLLPKPIQRPLGRGKGTTTLYPVGTGQQLIALCSLHTKARNFKVLGWRLWWAGFEVDEKYWLKNLKTTAKWSDKVINFVKKSAFDKDLGFEELSDEAFDVFNSHARKRSKLSIWRSFRKRIGNKSIELIGKIVLQIIAGKFTPQAVNGYHDTEQRKIDNAAIFKGFGFRQKSKHQPPNLNTIDLNHLLEELHNFSKLLDTHSLSDAANIGPLKIQLAQKELVSTMSLILKLYAMLEKLGRAPKEFKTFIQIAKFNDPNSQRLLLLLFIILKQGPNKNEEISDFISLDAVK